MDTCAGPAPGLPVARTTRVGETYPAGLTGSLQAMTSAVHGLCHEAPELVSRLYPEMPGEGTNSVASTWAALKRGASPTCPRRARPLGGWQAFWLDVTELPAPWRACSDGWRIPRLPWLTPAAHA